jgi:hypothetical protein
MFTFTSSKKSEPETHVNKHAMCNKVLEIKIHCEY